MKITREIKTAVLVIASILLFIWGYSFLKGRDLFNSYKTFYATYDNVEGLAQSAPVTINGLVVGKVNKVTLQPDARLLVEIHVNTDFPISKSSKINLYEPGLIGGKQIEIVPNLSDPEQAQSGDTLEGTTKPGLTALVGQKLTPLQEKIEKMVVSADAMLNNVNQVLDAKTKENLRSSIANLNATLVEFKGASQSLNGMLAENRAKINTTMSNVDRASGNFAKLSDSLAQANIGKTVKNLENTLAKMDAIIHDVQAGKGTMGKLMKDETLYNNFSKTAKELELLLQDLRLNPTRYVNVSLFGKKNKPYVAPEVDSLGQVIR